MVNIKIGIVIVVLVLLSLASASAALTKETIDVGGKYPDILIRSNGNPAVRLSLVSNTETCAGWACEAVIKMDNYVAWSLPAQFDNNFNFRFYDLKKAMQEKGLAFRVMVATNNVTVNEFINQTCTSTQAGNGSLVWSCVNNYKIVSKPDYHNLNLNTNVPIGTYYIKINGYKDSQDTIDWIPSVRGFNLNEWATWGASGLNNNIASYFSLNETTGNIGYNAYKIYNATGLLNGWTTGISGNGINCSALTQDANIANTKMKNNNYMQSSATKQWAINMWLYVSGNFDDYDSFLGTYTGVAEEGAFKCFIQKNVNVNKTGCYFFEGASLKNMEGAAVIPPKVWTMFTVQYDGTDYQIYHNGTLVLSLNNVNYDHTTTMTKNVSLCYSGSGSDYATNILIDEVSFYNSSLNATALADLYNAGLSMPFEGSGGGGGDTPPNNSITTTLISPANNVFTNNTYVTLTAQAAPVDMNVTNVTFYYASSSSPNIWLVLNTNTTAATQNTPINISYGSVWGEGSYIWNARSCGSNGTFSNCSFASSNFTFTVDATPPTLAVTSPTGSQGVLTSGKTLNLNYSVSGATVCNFSYDGVIRTLNCSATNFVFNATTATSLIVSVSDNASNVVTNLTSWSYLYNIMNVSWSNLTHETKSESYVVNFTANNIDSVNMIYGASTYPATLTLVSGTTYTANVTLDVPLVTNSQENQSKQFYWSFTSSDGTSITTNYTQMINKITFNICNATLNSKYFNVSFTDIKTSNKVNASIYDSGFTYYIGSGRVNRSFSYLNTTNPPWSEYVFCFNNNTQPLTISSFIQAGSSLYPTVTVTPPTFTTPANTMTNLSISLLSILDGIDVSFLVIDDTEEPIQGVYVNVSREVGGVVSVVTSDITDQAGTVSFFLDSDYDHTITFTKDGYITKVYTVQPTQSSYTVQLRSIGRTITDLGQNVTVAHYPKNTTLMNFTNYQWWVQVNSTKWTLEEIGMVLTGNNGTVIYSNVSTTSSIIAIYAKTYNYTYIDMRYWYTLNGTVFNNTLRYYVNDLGMNSEYSIYRFFTDLKMYLNAGLFGATDFTIGLISFIGIFVFVGVLSYRFGLTSPVSIVGAAASLVFFLDVGVGLVPSVGGVAHAPTIVIGGVFLAVFLNEVRK